MSWRGKNHDPRLFKWMEDVDNAAQISTGFGRIFLEELAAQKAEGKIPD
jgi:hypothetical protein